MMIKGYYRHGGDTPLREVKQEPRSLDFLKDVTLQCTVEFGRAEMTIRQFLALTAGSIIELDKLEGEALEIRANGNMIGRGEAVVVNEKYGIRLTEVTAPEDDHSSSA